MHASTNADLFSNLEHTLKQCGDSIHQETADALIEEDPEPLSFNMDNVRTAVKKAQDSMSIIRGFLRKTGQ